MHLRNNLLAIFALTICSTCAHAQFSTVINLPEDPNDLNLIELSGSVGSDTQLNISDGGMLGPFFNAVSYTHLTLPTTPYV